MATSHPTIRVKTIRDIKVFGCHKGLTDQWVPRDENCPVWVVPVGTEGEAELISQEGSEEAPTYRVWFPGYGERNYRLSDLPYSFDVLGE
jgi:hypothetical protein